MKFDRGALKRMTALSKALSNDAPPAALDLKEGLDRLTPRRALQAWRQGFISRVTLGAVVDHVVRNARQSADAIDRMQQPPDRDGLMARIMTTTRDAITDVINAAGRLHTAALAEAWDAADIALTDLESAQHFLTQISNTGSLA